MRVWTGPFCTHYGQMVNKEIQRNDKKWNSKILDQAVV